MERKYIKLLDQVTGVDPIVVIDNRDVDTTWIWVGTLYGEITRDQLLFNLATIHEVGHVIQIGEFYVRLEEDDIRYLIENMDENNEEVNIDLDHCVVEDPEEMGRIHNQYNERLLRIVLDHMYTLAVDDDGTMEMLTSLTDMDAKEVLDSFNDLAEDCGLVLDKKINGVWGSMDPLHGLLTGEQFTEVFKVYKSLENNSHYFPAEVRQGTYTMILETMIPQYIHDHFGISMSSTILDTLLELLHKEFELGQLGNI